MKISTWAMRSSLWTLWLPKQPHSPGLSLASRAWPSEYRIHWYPYKYGFRWMPTLLRFSAPSARSVASPLDPGLPHPIRSAFRFSQPLDGLLLATPCGLVSCHWHSWGFPVALPPGCSTAPSSGLVATTSTYPVSTHIRRLGCAWIVRLYLPEDKCDPTNTPITWRNPLPGPFAARLGVNRGRWPLLPRAGSF